MESGGIAIVLPSHYPLVKARSCLFTIPNASRKSAIPIFLDDRIIRPLVGDGLAIPLIYCFIKAFWPLRPAPAALLVFAFACLLEALQYLRLVDRLGLRDNPLLATIL